MIRELWNFLAYSWQTLEVWAKLLIFTVLLHIAAVFVSEDLGRILQLSAWMIITVMALTFWIKQHVIPKWHKYKQHRNHLLTTIKHSNHD